ncbi:hypothetical protein [Sphingobium cupriresistens]|uniref:hypothetical protein n=1 Tax=Sphingobium cupriresistens TaxID=1132417 RepID=UPI003BADD55D
MEQIEQVRAAVVDALKARDIGRPVFWDDILEGRRDDTPFMVGALIWAEHVRAAAK